MRSFLILFLALPIAAMANSVDVDTKASDCFCTDSVGARVELGESICLKVGDRAFIARCEMVLNNPAWRDTGVGCVTSLPKSQSDQNDVAS